MKSLQNNFQKNLRPKKLRKQSTKNNWKRNLYKQIFERKIQPKYIWKIRYQTICDGELFTKHTLNRNLFQTNSKRNFY